MGRRHLRELVAKVLLDNIGGDPQLLEETADQVVSKLRKFDYINEDMVR